ncbi:MAG: exodeoxyribonuclease VII small subunit [Saprospiraceae bacterium]
MKKSKLTYEESLKILQDIIENLQNDRYSMEELSIALIQAKEIISNCEETLRGLQDKISEINT